MFDLDATLLCTQQVLQEEYCEPYGQQTREYLLALWEAVGITDRLRFSKQQHNLDLITDLQLSCVAPNAGQDDYCKLRYLNERALILTRLGPRLYPDAEELIDLALRENWHLVLSSVYDAELAKLAIENRFKRQIILLALDNARVGASKAGVEYYLRSEAMIKSITDCSFIVVIGDSKTNDYDVPLKAGLRAILLDRRGDYLNDKSILRVSNLIEAFQIILEWTQSEMVGLEHAQTHS
jgi:FMN phosphatase YigB (HAD superfamily)